MPHIGGIKLGDGGADGEIMQERRSEARMMCADVIEVVWKDKAGRQRRATALLEDISPSGACLQLEMAMPQGSVIHWNCGAKPFSGRVRYCAYRDIGYFVGVEFEAGARWSTEVYRPPHLLNLERLSAGAKK